jgi:hypothetical protein
MMQPGLRKFALTTHISMSVGWVGAVFAYLVLVAAAMTSEAEQTLRSAWIAMDLIGWYLIVPLALASLLTGLVMSLGTQWGLIRHYWVLISFLLTLFATTILLLHMPAVSFFAGVAASGEGAVTELRRALPGELLHAGVGVVLLLAIQALNVYKPQGMTAYGRRRGSEAAVSARPALGVGPGPSLLTTSRTPRWALIVGIHAIGLVLLFVVLHLTGGGMSH